MKIFISYRRADAIDATGRMFDRLVAKFGKANVFKDVDSIPLGSDFANVIGERLSDCDVVIVVIGRFWLNVQDEEGLPRLQNPGDYVRIEIEQALNSRALVVPALTANVAMPREQQLPESIRKLARRNAIPIRPDPDFHRDMDRLIAQLDSLVVRSKPQTRHRELRSKPSTEIPTPNTEIPTWYEQECPSCERLVRIRDVSLVGKKVICPKCRFRFVAEMPDDREIAGITEEDVEIARELRRKLRSDSNRKRVTLFMIALISVIAVAGICAALLR